jgi:phosphonate transport system permease protein
MMNAELQRLHAARPRSLFLRGSILLLALLFVGVWFTGDYSVGDLLTERRWSNVQRFSQEVTPLAWRQTHSLGATFSSWQTLMLERGLPAIWNTLLMSVAGISVAAVLALLTLPWVASVLARGRPYEAEQSWPWRCAHGLARFAVVLARSVPEYVIAFILLALLGPNAWPVVLALGIHNLGILSRLGAEALENMEPELARGLTQSGHGRWQLYLTSLTPALLPRFLVYFFYRWETCVRDASVLGLLGCASIGYYVRDARARQLHDEMVVFILLGSVLVVAGDYFSSWVRRQLRA